MGKTNWRTERISVEKLLDDLRVCLLYTSKNGRFQVADSPDFRDARTVYVTPEVPEARPYYAQLGDSITSVSYTHLDEFSSALSSTVT